MLLNANKTYSFGTPTRYVSRVAMPGEPPYATKKEISCLGVPLRVDGPGHLSKRVKATLSSITRLGALRISFSQKAHILLSALLPAGLYGAPFASLTITSIEQLRTAIVQALWGTGDTHRSPYMVTGGLLAAHLHDPEITWAYRTVLSFCSAWTKNPHLQTRFAQITTLYNERDSTHNSPAPAGPLGPVGLCRYAALPMANISWSLPPAPAPPGQSTPPTPPPPAPPPPTPPTPSLADLLTADPGKRAHDLRDGLRTFHFAAVTEGRTSNACDATGAQKIKHAARSTYTGLTGEALLKLTNAEWKRTERSHPAVSKRIRQIIIGGIATRAWTARWNITARMTTAAYAATLLILIHALTKPPPPRPGPPRGPYITLDVDSLCIHCPLRQPDSLAHIWWICPAFSQVRTRYPQLTLLDRTAWPACFSNHTILPATATISMQTHVTQLQWMYAAILDARLLLDTAAGVASGDRHAWRKTPTALKQPQSVPLTPFLTLLTGPPEDTVLLVAVLRWAQTLSWAKGSVTTVELCLDLLVTSGLRWDDLPGSALRAKAVTLRKIIKRIADHAVKNRVDFPFPAPTPYVTTLRTVGGPQMTGYAGRPQLARLTMTILEEQLPVELYNDSETTWGTGFIVNVPQNTTAYTALLTAHTATLARARGGPLRLKPKRTHRDAPPAAPPPKRPKLATPPTHTAPRLPPRPIPPAPRRPNATGPPQQRPPPPVQRPPARTNPRVPPLAPPPAPRRPPTQPPPQQPSPPPDRRRRARTPTDPTPKRPRHEGPPPRTARPPDVYTSFTVVPPPIDPGMRTFLTFLYGRDILPPDPPRAPALPAPIAPPTPPSPPPAQLSAPDQPPHNLQSPTARHASQVPEAYR